MVKKILSRFESQGIPGSWYDGKTILVTGGAGFIGSWLVEALTLLKAKVFVVDNLWRGSIQNLMDSNGHEIIPLKEQFIKGDLRDYNTTFASLKNAKPDLIFHLADIVAGIDYVFSNEPEIFRSNVLINSNVYTAAAEVGVEQVVYLGTACSYPKEMQMETGRPPLVEDDVYPANPESAYGWSKLMGEFELDMVARYSGMSIGILRLHNVYGPRSILSRKRSQVIPSLIRKAILYPGEDFIVWGTGRQARDFVFVGDVIDAILRTPLKGMDQGVIQIGTRTETSVAALASMIVRISGKDIPIKFDPMKPEGDIGRSGNYDKAKSILGWDVFTNIEDGLRQTYEWALCEITNKPVDLDG